MLIVTKNKIKQKQKINTTIRSPPISILNKNKTKTWNTTGKYLRFSFNVMPKVFIVQRTLKPNILTSWTCEVDNLFVSQ